MPTALDAQGVTPGANVGVGAVGVGVGAPVGGSMPEF